MRPSKYKQEKIQELKKKAYLLHKSGLSTREIAPIVKRSYVWVSLAVKEMKKG